ncbi:unnamed protein product [Didymodactylos carnosus]|uniref:Mitochondrial ribosomal protein S2 n=1 Tax=Didymodactylos carnosus TaxID=1234261 RepID=A0A8S2FTQ5_9BILA|nr:unnamed protein product [Didymodactylos carnosus]CAF4347057.1 unnamed protein product [Didymodactylos carnosus]
MNIIFKNLLQKTANSTCHRTFNRGVANTQAQRQHEHRTVSNEISQIEKSNIGEKSINPLDHPDFFNVRNLVTLEDLFKNRAHYGHVTGMRNPWMNDYIYGHRLNTDIIDLDKTLPMLQNALNFLAHIAYRKGIILFLTRYPQHIPLVEKYAQECSEYAHCRNWEGHFTDIQRLFGYDIRLPDLCIFLHTLHPLNYLHPAVSDSNKMLIPTIALCDTDCNPNIVTYPIPSNDDTPQTIEFYLKLFKQAILNGKIKRKEMEDKGLIEKI